MKEPFHRRRDGNERRKCRDAVAFHLNQHQRRLERREGRTAQSYDVETKITILYRDRYVVNQKSGLSVVPSFIINMSQILQGRKSDFRG